MQIEIEVSCRIDDVEWKYTLHLDQEKWSKRNIVIKELVLKTGKPIDDIHWCPDGGWQREDQFPDGSLRLLGSLWCPGDKGGVLLLEDAEPSLHSKLVCQLPSSCAGSVHVAEAEGGTADVPVALKIVATTGWLVGTGVEKRGMPILDHEVSGELGCTLLTLVGAAGLRPGCALRAGTGAEVQDVYSQLQCSTFCNISRQRRESTGTLPCSISWTWVDTSYPTRLVFTR